MIKIDDFIFNLKSIKYMIINDSFERIPMLLKSEMIQFYLSLKFNFNFLSYDIHQPLDNLYTRYKKPGSDQFLIDNNNLSMLNITKVRDEEKFSFENLHKRNEFMLFILQNFSKSFKKLAVSKKSLLKRIFSLFKFFEFCFARPVNVLINRYLINSQNITGKESFNIYHLTVEFLKVTIFFYENMDTIYQNTNIEDEFDKNILYTKNVFNYEEIFVRSKLDTDEITKLNLELTNLKQTVKYFELNKIISIFKKTINIIIGVYREVIVENNQKSEHFDFSSLSNFISVGQNMLGAGQSLLSSGLNHGQNILTTGLAQGQNLINSGQNILNRGIDISDVKNFIDGGVNAVKSLINRAKTKIGGGITDNIQKITMIERNIVDNIDNFALAYKNVLADSYGPKLSFINILNNNSESDEEIDFNMEIFMYLINKMCEEVTPNNMARFKKSDFNVNDIHDLSLSNVQLQNLYTLIYLNSLFYHNSEKFQELMADELEDDDTNHFLKFICKDLIFSCLLNETKKNYDLDNFIPKDEEGYLTKSVKASFSFEVLSLCIKFLQNLCENHNHYFQNTLFNMEFRDLIEQKEIVIKEQSKDDEDTEKNNQSRMTKGVWGIPSSKSFLISSKVAIRNATLAEVPLDKLNSKLMADKINQKISKGDSDEELETSKDGEQVNDIDRKKSKNEVSKAESNIKKYSFFNFICMNMRIIIHQMHMKNSDILSDNKLNKSYENCKQLFKMFSDLMIEMIQGIPEKQYDNFIRKLPKSFKSDEHNFLSNEILEDHFFFVSLIKDIQYFVFNENHIYDQMTFSFKYQCFLIMTNLITSEIAPNYIMILKLLVAVFPPDDLITLIAKYLKALYVKHIYKIDYSHKDFDNEVNALELTKDNFSEIYSEFKTNIELSGDNYFQLSSQMYLFLVVLGNLQSVPEAERILELQNQEIIFEYESEGLVDVPFLDILKAQVRQFFNEKLKIFGFGNQMVEKKKKIIHSLLNNEIVASMFYNRVVRSCEFLISQDRGGEDFEEDKTIIKKIYFIINPDVYLISNTNIDNFFEVVDRKTPTNKLKSLVVALDTFVQEVKFKKERLGENPSLKWMLDIEYKDVDYMNFIISLIINLILLIYLEGDNLNFNKAGYYYIIKTLIYIQILINLAYTAIFLFSKYSFYVILETEKRDNEKMNILEKFKMTVIDCFLLNEEIYILLLNIVVGYLCLTTTYTTFLVSLQLFTVIKFVPTINEIVIAFKIRFGQLMSMIGFLGIIIFFYSNIGFFFINTEFYTILDDGVKENLCSSLLECAVTYFNLGVRSGGGIGDLLNEKKYSEPSLYWVRWISDMIFYITVILLLMNMINGVIVSTFSQIREESNEKEEDINNKCFICSIDRVEFEKRNIPFTEHLKEEHNSRNYIKFLVNLKLSNEKELDSDQFYINTCIKNNDVACFPVSKSLSLGNLEDQEDGGESEDEESN